MTYSNRKVGGIRFIRIWKLQFMFCVVRRPAPQVRSVVE